MANADGDAPVQKHESKNCLVPVVTILRALPSLSHLQSEASFLMHLIVTADPFRQLRTARPATPHEAHAAYETVDQGCDASGAEIRKKGL
jgi:hypothetical protein